MKTHVTGRKHMVSSVGLVMIRGKHFKTYILLTGVHVRESQLAITSIAWINVALTVTLAERWKYEDNNVPPLPWPTIHTHTHTRVCTQASHDRHHASSMWAAGISTQRRASQQRFVNICWMNGFLPSSSLSLEADLESCSVQRLGSKKFSNQIAMAHRLKPACGPFTIS